MLGLPGLLPFVQGVDAAQGVAAPATLTACPDVNDAASVHRNVTTAAVSSGRWKRPMGIWSRIQSSTLQGGNVTKSSSQRTPLFKIEDVTCFRGGEKLGEITS